MQDSKTYPIKVGAPLLPAGLFASASLFFSINLVGSDDAAAALVGKLCLALLIVGVIAFVVALVVRKSTLLVGEDGFTLRLLFSSHNYSWSDLHSVSQSTDSAGRSHIRLVLRNGKALDIPGDLSDPAAVFAHLQQKHEPSQPAA